MKVLVVIAALTGISAQAQTCTREGLKAIAANYFQAVETHQMSALATTANVRITENAAEIKPGEGLFKTGGKTQLQRTIVDTGKCSTLTQAVMDETAAKTGLLLMAVRLKSEGGKVSEIETIIARTGDFAFKPQGVLDTKDQDWGTLMPATQRRTREFLNGQADKYYEMFADHKVDPGFAAPCNRWENGTLTTAKGDCSWNGAVMTHPRRRFPVTDVDLGVAAAITNFRDDWLDVHIFKFNKDGKIGLIQAVDGPGTKGTGWPYDKERLCDLNNGECSLSLLRCLTLQSHSRFAGQGDKVRFLIRGASLPMLIFILNSVANSVAQAQAQPQRLGTEFGISAFERECTKCHGNAAVDRAPSPAAIRQMPPERIYAAITTGIMKTQAANLSDEQKRRLAEYMGGRPLGSAALADASQMPNRCAAGSTLPDPSKGPAWNGWGVDAHNTRFQGAVAAGITVAQVPNLKLKWAFGFPLGVSAFGQPSVAAGRVFVGSDIGYVYSLDMHTGCVYWSYQAKAAIRTAVTIGPTGSATPSRYAVYFGDMQANVYAVDAASGALLWTKRAEDHFAARITAAPTLYEGRIYVPVSTSEGFSASTPDYPCCTFRGSVSSLDAATGAQIWKTYTIPESKPTKKNSIGTQLWAPSGVAVWNSPTVDAKRRAIYFGTGDSATEPAPDTSDSIMALDLDTGKVRWVFQAEPNDATLGGCGARNKSEACPEHPGPDWDFGASPILTTIPGGSDLLLAPNKSGIVFALDPDSKGTVVWKTNLAEREGSRGTNLVWGGSADQRNLYVGLASGAITAVQFSTGEKLWTKRLTEPGSRESNVAASSAIPGAVFIGGTDGKLHGLASTDGHELWSFDTAKEFMTVNQVPAHGGSIGSIGPTIAGGMVFIGSGYSVASGTPGNVLLAFGTE